MRLLLPLLLASIAFGADPALEKAERSWAASILKADLAALDKLLAPELTYTHSNGKRDTKATYIESLKSGSLKYLSVEYEELKTEVYGDTGLAVLKLKVRASNAGTVNDFNLSALHVFLKRKGQWVMLAHQSARLP